MLFFFRNPCPDENDMICSALLRSQEFMLISPEICKIILPLGKTVSRRRVSRYGRAVNGRQNFVAMQVNDLRLM